MARLMFRVAAPIVLAAASLLGAADLAAAPAAPARWLLVVPPVTLDSYPTEQACREALGRRQAGAARLWRFRVALYYERIASDPEPRDDLERVKLWLAFRQVKQAQHTLDLLRQDATCRRAAAVPHGS